MNSSTVDHHVLFAVLALKAGFVSRDALGSALSTWLLDKSKSLGWIFVERRVISEGECALLEALTRAHSARHGGDPRKSLASVGVPDPVRIEFGRFADADLSASLGAAATVGADDPEATETVAVGAPTATGQRFRILRPHARGGLGEVSVAFDEELHREVALKELQERFVHDAQLRARFLLEAEITGSLEHPGIVPVYGLGQYADGRPFYAMRLIKGESLREAIARFHGPLASKDAGERNWEFRRLLARLLAVCNAIEYAHSRGVLHRDLKPGNIMLGEYGETLVVDWGLAKLVARADVDGNPVEPLQPTSGDGLAPTMVGRAVGTLPYMSPEQAAGRANRLGPAGDVYSLGATLYQLLTGQSPFHGVPKHAMTSMILMGRFDPPRAIKAEVPAPLEAICLKAMALKPKDRHRSAHALAEDLERWLTDEPVAAYRTAVALHEERMKEHPGRVKDQEALARIHSNLGNALHFLGRNAEAEAVHRTAVAEFRALADRNPGGAEYREKLAVAYTNLGWVLRALGRKDDADEAYAAAVAEYKRLPETSATGRAAQGNPGLTALFISQGWPSGLDPPSGTAAAAAPTLGADDEAARALAARVRDRIEALDAFARGKVAYKEGAIDRALAEFGEAIRLDPQYAEAYNRRGNVHLDRGEPDRAIADYTRAIGLDPDDPVFYYNRGKAHDSRSEFAAAIADFTEAILLDPQFTKAHTRRSKAYNALGM